MSPVDSNVHSSMSPKGVEHNANLKVVLASGLVHSSMSPKGVEHVTPVLLPMSKCVVHSSMSPKGVEHLPDLGAGKPRPQGAFINVAERR